MYLLSWSNGMFVCRILSNKLDWIHFDLTSVFGFYICIVFGLQTMSVSRKMVLKSQTSSLLLMPTPSYVCIQKCRHTPKLLLLPCILSTLNSFFFGIRIIRQFEGWYKWRVLNRINKINQYCKNKKIKLSNLKRTIKHFLTCYNE